MPDVVGYGGREPELGEIRRRKLKEEIRQQKAGTEVERNPLL